MSIEILHDWAERRTGAVLTDTTDGMAFGPLFADDTEADAFVAWFERPQASDGRMVEVAAMRRWTYDEQKATADVWRRVWVGMAANPSHEHNPGCSYQGRCSCGWVSGWGDSDNAFHTSWDHKHEATDGQTHRTTSVHR